MAPRRCCIKDCGSIAGREEHRGVTFHSFPPNPITRQAWLQNAKVPTTKIITKSVLICSRHFRRADFQPLKNEKYFLKIGAVPTIFPWGTLPYVEPVPPTTPTGTATTTVAKTATAIVQKSSNKSIIATTSNASGSGTKKDEQKVPNPELTDPESLISAIKSEMNSPLKRTSSFLNERKTEAKKMRQSIVDASNKSSDRSDAPSSIVDPSTAYTPGSRIEAQDFNGAWHSAKVVEVDNEEREVFITFESGKAKTQGAVDEWISMNSSRLRPMQPVKKTSTTYSIGEKCMSRWTDSRKFPATVQKILDNNMYEVLFDDGFKKIVKGCHMSKLKSPDAKPSTAGRKAIPPPPIPKFDLSKLNLLPVPEDGEWCCNWVNDTPIGKEGYLDGPDGHRRPTVLVEDWRLPSGWMKHLYQRSSVSGKWDVVLVGPNKKRFRSKADVKVYLEEIGQVYNPDIYDFSIHKRRAKDIGLFIFTDDYKEMLRKKQQVSATTTTTTTATTSTTATATDKDGNKTAAGLNTLADCSNDDLFTGFSPAEAESNNKTINDAATPNKSAPAQTQSQTLELGYVFVGSLKVQIVDNLFRCPDKSCNKNFRKENHLQMHVKHYHEEMAKLLGVCPNMTDLAYLRTIGQPLDEAVPKNQIPNAQFFEKAYQSEVAMKPLRKSISSPTVVGTKIDKRSNTITSSNAESTKIDDSNKRQAVDVPMDKISTTKSSDLVQRKTNELSKTAASDGGGGGDDHGDVKMKEYDGTSRVAIPKQIDAEELIQSHAVPRQMTNKKSTRRKRLVLKSGLSKGSIHHKIHRVNKYNPDLSDIDVQMDDSHSDHMILKQLHQSNGGYSDADNNYKKTFTDTGEIHVDPSPKYINENGEMIKIVRMRQEEIINCLCAYPEEDGLMIQCELCLCWQHSICNGIERESQVPDKYICYICKNPWLGRDSMKYVHDQEWLFEGKLPVTNFKTLIKQSENIKHTERFDLLKQSHTLAGNLMELKQFMHSLKVKINIAGNKDHPKLYLWATKWEPNNTQRNEVKVERNGQEIKIKNSNSNEVIDGSNNTNGVQNAEVKDENGEPITHSIVPQPEAPIDNIECQHRLFEHIEKQQTLAMTRLQTIEAHIIALESMDEKYASAEAVDSFSATKKTIAMFIDDLSSLSKLADYIKPETKEDQPQLLF